MTPSYASVTSEGSIMAAPPGPISFSTPSSARLTMTAQGMRAYLVKMGGILGPALSLTLMNAQAEYLKTGSWEPIDDKHAALFTLIFDRIVPALEGHDGLIVRMSQKCGTNGPKALHWLTTQLDPQTEASSVLKLIQVFQKQLSSDNMISDMQQLISANDTLAGSDFHLNAKIISSLLLAKLPSAHTATRASIVQRAEIPSPDDIITIFTTTLGFDAAGQESTKPRCLVRIGIVASTGSGRQSGGSGGVASSPATRTSRRSYQFGILKN